MNLSHLCFSKDKSETRNDFEAKLVDNILIADFLDKSGKTCIFNMRRLVSTSAELHLLNFINQYLITSFAIRCIEYMSITINKWYLIKKLDTVD